MLLSVIKEYSCFLTKCVALSLGVFISKVGLILPMFIGLLGGLDKGMDVMGLLNDSGQFTYSG